MILVVDRDGDKHKMLRFLQPIEKSARRSVSRVLSRPPGEPMGRGWPFIWDVRYRTPHATDPSGGAEGPPGGPGKRRICLPLLLGLAPGGVFPATAVAGGAVRSYRTISPLPPMRSHNGAGTGSAVCFCGTFPGVAPAGRYPAPCLRGARTFLPSPKPRGPDEERPSDRLAWDYVGSPARAVKGRAFRPPRAAPAR